MAAAPPLPTSFPCWCRAIYSWGGEKKQDLGFIEGDLIECLNAGDGSWWMGRLRRDKRMAGLFPSNFVEILPDSAIPSLVGTPTTSTTPGSRSEGSRSPSPLKSTGTRSWRKPFQAYSHANSPNSGATANANGSTAAQQPQGSVKEKRSLRPYASMKTAKAPEGQTKGGQGADDQSWIPAPVRRDGEIPHDPARPSSRAHIQGSLNGRGRSDSLSQGNSTGNTPGPGYLASSMGPGHGSYHHGSIRDREWNASYSGRNDRQSNLPRPRSSVGLYRPEETQYQNSNSNSSLTARHEYKINSRQNSGTPGLSGSFNQHTSLSQAPLGSEGFRPGSSLHSRSNSDIHLDGGAEPGRPERSYNPGYEKGYHPGPGQGYLHQQRELRERMNSKRRGSALGHARSRTDLGMYPSHSVEPQQSFEYGGNSGHYSGLNHSPGPRDRQNSSHSSSHSRANSFSQHNPGDYVPQSETVSGRLLLPDPASLSRPGSAIGRPRSAVGRPGSSVGLSLSRPGSSMGNSAINNALSQQNFGPAYPSNGPPATPAYGAHAYSNSLSRPGSSMGARPGTNFTRPGSSMGSMSRPGSSMGMAGIRPGSSAGTYPSHAAPSIAMAAANTQFGRQILAPVRQNEMNDNNIARERHNRMYSTESFSRVPDHFAKLGMGPDASPEHSPPPPPPPPHRRAPITTENSQLPSAGRSSLTPAGAHTPETQPDSRLTPSPLRSAMEDVMTSLDEMGLRAQATSGSVMPRATDSASNNNDDDEEATPSVPWSPEEIDWRHAKRREREREKERQREFESRPASRAEQKAHLRPMSALGVDDCGLDVLAPGPPSPPRARERSPMRNRSPSAHRSQSRRRADTGGSGSGESFCGSEHPGSLTPGRRGRSNTLNSPARLTRPKSSIGFGGLLHDPNPGVHTFDAIKPSDSAFGPGLGSLTKSRTALSNRKSAFELGRGMSFNKGSRPGTSSVTGSVSGSDVLSASGSQYSAAMHSLASGLSSGTGMSATSAGSLARRRWTQGQGPPQGLSRLGVHDTSLDQTKPPGQTNPIHPSAPQPNPSAGITMSTPGITYHNNADPVVKPTPTSMPPPDKRKTTAGGFLRRLLGGGRTIAASAREKTRARSRSRPGSRLAGLVRKNESSPVLSGTESGVSSATYGASNANSQGGQAQGGMGETDWIAVRRDVNRTNSISQNERAERAERCTMQDVPVIAPLEWLDGIEGDEGIDGLAVAEPAEFGAASLALVDRTVRAMNVPWTSFGGGNRGSVFGMPVPLPTIAGFTTSQLCRPFRSEIQRLRAIFCFVSERVRWEPGLDLDVNLGAGSGEDVEAELSRVLQTGRASSSEMARLVAAMCSAVGIHAVAVCGYLKRPVEPITAGDLPNSADPVSGNLLLRSNHAWTTVLVGGEWRIIDCALASASNPVRSQFSSLDVAARSGEARPVASGGGSLIHKANVSSPMLNHHGIPASSGAGTAADTFWFLARPGCVLFTHIPKNTADQRVVPPLPSAVQLSLPVACPAYFKHNLQLDKTFATSDTELLGLEVAHIKIRVPADVECVAEVRVPALGTDRDGDRFETGDELCVAALCQADWIENVENGRLEKWFIVKAVLPGDDSGNSLSSSGVLRIYAGKRGLMHSLRSNPHALALAIGLRHLGGENPPLGFVIRHPTPQALRQDLYAVQPQCWKVKVGNTYVFSVRQAASDPYAYSLTASNAGPVGIGGFGSGRLARPASMASIASVSNAGSAFSVRSEDNLSEQGSQTSQNMGALGASGGNGWKPAKLAIQSPGGKIIRLMRRTDLGGNTAVGAGGTTVGDGSYAANLVGGTWETVIKVTEKGTWRGLVLADRTARWCVWGEWECV